jgi:hypothetical protein
MSPGETAMTTVKPPPDYAAIMRAPPNARDQRALDVLGQVLRDLRGSSLAFFPAQGAPRELGPPKEQDGIGKGLAQARADGSIGEPIDGGKRKDASGREFKITRWNAPDGKLAAVLLEPVLGGKGERVLIAPDAKRPGNARLWHDDHALVPWGLAREIMREVRAGNTGARSGTDFKV